MPIQTVETSRQWRAFIALPWSIYGDNRYWVPPLWIAVRGVLNRSNPFFRHATLYPLLAYENDKPVGRIAGILDDVHNAYHAERTAFFWVLRMRQRSGGLRCAARCGQRLGTRTRHGSAARSGKSQHQS